MTPFLSLLSPSCFLYNLSLKPLILEHPLKDISFVRMMPRDNSFLQFLFLFFNGRKIALQGVVLVYAMQQCESPQFYIYHLPLEPPSPTPAYPSGSSQSSRLGSLCYTAASHQLFRLHLMVYTCLCYFLRLQGTILKERIIP